MEKETVPKQKAYHDLCSSLVFLTGFLSAWLPSHQLTQSQKPLSERKLDIVTPLLKTFRRGSWK